MLNDVRLSDWDDESRQPVLDAERVELELSAIAALRGDVVISTAQAGAADPLRRAGRTESLRAGGAERRPHPPRASNGRARSWPANPADPDISAAGRRFVRHGRVQRRPGRGTGRRRQRRADHDRTCRRRRMERAQPRGDAFGHAASGAARASRSTRRRPSRWCCLPAARRRCSIDVKAAPASGSFDGAANLSRELLLRRPADVHLAVAAGACSNGRAPTCRQAQRSGSVALSGKITRRPQARSNSTTPRSRSTAIRAPACSTCRSAKRCRRSPARSPSTSSTCARSCRPSRRSRRAADRRPARSTSPSPRSTISTSGFRPRKATAGDFSLHQRRRDGAGQGRPHRFRYFRRDDLRRHRAGRPTLRPQGRRRQPRDPAAGQRHRRRQLRRGARQVDARGADRQGHGVGDAQGPGRDWDSFLETADGSFSASFGPGSVNGFDLAAFLDRFKQGGFFPLRDVSSGSRSDRPRRIRASSPTAWRASRRPRPRSASACIGCPGVVPYVGGGLALSGGVVARRRQTRRDATSGRGVVLRRRHRGARRSSRRSSAARRWIGRDCGEND